MVLRSAPHGRSHTASHAWLGHPQASRPAVAAVAALTIALGAQALSMVTTEDLTPVLVAARYLEAGTILQREDIRIDLVPTATVGEASQFSDEEFAGAVLTEDLAEGMRLTGDAVPGTLLQGRITGAETVAAAPSALVSTRITIGSGVAQQLRQGASVRLVVAGPSTGTVAAGPGLVAAGAPESIIGASGGGVAQPNGDGVARPAAQATTQHLSTPPKSTPRLPDTRVPEVNRPNRTPSVASAAPTRPTVPVRPPAASPSPPSAAAAPPPRPTPSPPQSTVAAPAPRPTGGGNGPQPRPRPPAAAVPSSAPTRVPAVPQPAVPERVATPPVGQVVVSDAKIVAVEPKAPTVPKPKGSRADEVKVVIETAPEEVPALVRYEAEEELAVEILAEDLASPPSIPAEQPGGMEAEQRGGTKGGEAGQPGGTKGAEVAPTAPTDG